MSGANANIARTTAAPSGGATEPTRVAAVFEGHPAARELVERLNRVAISGLPDMFRPDARTFARTRRRAADGSLELAGESVRYGAITLLGIRPLPEEVQRTILHGDTAASFCGHLIGRVETMTDLGDVALIAWAAAEMDHLELPAALARLRVLDDGGPCETVPAGWVVSALTAARHAADTADATTVAARRLLGCYLEAARIFPHVTDRSIAPRGRGHVGCFADQVYPIQALARYGRAFDDEEAMRAANGCAARICEVMGPNGQWWWHYDARTGDVVEGYPVYTVHQDSMAPMALLDLADNGGEAHPEAIRRGLSWMDEASEIRRCLIDDERGMIWRKVGRSDLRKLVRAARAGVSRLHPKLRLRALDVVFPATRVDHECRPYHLGWILYAWLREDRRW